MLMVASVFSREASMAAGSRFSGGVLMRPQNMGVIAGPATESCQSIQLHARERARKSFGSSEPAPYFAAIYRTMEFDSQRMNPSSSRVGTRPFGFMAR